MSWNKGLGLNMTSNRLRIDPNDGSPVLEYRVENGCFEHRTIGASAGPSATANGQWQRLTRDQMNSLVCANMVVAHRLSCRFGVHAVVRLQQILVIGDKWSRWSRAISGGVLLLVNSPR